jgi:hypothetical protein
VENQNAAKKWVLKKNHANEEACVILFFTQCRLPEMMIFALFSFRGARWRALKLDAECDDDPWRLPAEEELPSFLTGLWPRIAPPFLCIPAKLLALPFMFCSFLGFTIWSWGEFGWFRIVGVCCNSSSWDKDLSSSLLALGWFWLEPGCPACLGLSITGINFWCWCWCCLGLWYFCLTLPSSQVSWLVDLYGIGALSTDLVGACCTHGLGTLGTDPVVACRTHGLGNLGTDPVVVGCRTHGLRNLGTLPCATAWCCLHGLGSLGTGPPVERCSELCGRICKSCLSSTFMHRNLPQLLQVSNSVGMLLLHPQLSLLLMFEIGSKANV